MKWNRACYNRFPDELDIVLDDYFGMDGKSPKTDTESVAASIMAPIEFRIYSSPPRVYRSASIYTACVTPLLLAHSLSVFLLEINLPRWPFNVIPSAWSLSARAGDCGHKLDHSLESQDRFHALACTTLRRETTSSRLQQQIIYFNGSYFLFWFP